LYLLQFTCWIRGFDNSHLKAECPSDIRNIHINRNARRCSTKYIVRFSKRAFPWRRGYWRQIIASLTIDATRMSYVRMYICAKLMRYTCNARWHDVCMNARKRFARGSLIMNSLAPTGRWTMLDSIAGRMVHVIAHVRVPSHIGLHRCIRFAWGRSTAAGKHLTDLDRICADIETDESFATMIYATHCAVEILCACARAHVCVCVCVLEIKSPSVIVVAGHGIQKPRSYTTLGWDQVTFEFNINLVRDFESLK